MISLQNVTLRRGATILLEKVNWTIYPNQRIGLIGANGSGKTSLFTMLLKKLEPDVGDITFPKQLKLAHVAQETEASEQAAIEFVLDGDEELQALMHELSIAEQAHDGMRIAQLHEKLHVIDAYTATSRAAQLLIGLGFPHDDHAKPISAFSGGWRVRLNLARALMCRSDILLLDEPTNHLDLDAVLWLEQWIKNYAGTLLLISHDRDFLDQTVTSIAHITNKNLKLYTGNYSTFESLRANELLVQQAAFEKQQKKLAHMQSFVNRFKAKASKAKQAQSRLKAIEKMELVCAVQTESPFEFEFHNADYCPNPLLALHHAKISYGDKVVMRNLDFSITPKDRIAILGPNGAGKSSIIKLLAGELPATNEARVTANGLKIGYFAQHQVDHLNLDDTPLNHLREIAGKTADVDLRKFLGGFDFSGDTVTTPIRQFSGGEKSRLALALIIWQKPNLLLLDEPTNHLDLEMRNALSIALQEYEGAMILVSHDRFLVRSTTDTLWLAADGELNPFDGDLDDYQRWLLDYRKQQSSSEANKKNKPTASRKEQKQQAAKEREAKRPLLLKIEQLEKDIAKAHKQLAAIEEQLTNELLYNIENKNKLQSYLKDQAAIKKHIESLEEQWLHVHQSE